MAHGNARLTPLGRQLLVGRIERQGWTITAAAAATGVSRQTASKWLARARCEGTCGLADRRCRPHRVVYRLSGAALRPVVSLRLRLFGPAPIAWRLGLAGSTVYRALRRLGLSRLRDLRARATVVRYCWAAPGDLVHLDTKRLGRIGAGGGWRFAERSRKHRGIGWDLVHVAVDDATRLAYAEELTDERPASTAAFLERALAFFAAQGIEVRRLLTDNGMAYHSHLFRAAAARHGLRQLYTRPYRPQTNGKAEAFVKIVQNGWAYRRPYYCTAERIAALPGFLAYYNGYRPHGGLGGLTPIARLEAVNKVMVQNT
jgi:transposase InsO family protein